MRSFHHCRAWVNLSWVMVQTTHSSSSWSSPGTTRCQWVPSSLSKREKCPLGLYPANRESCESSFCGKPAISLHSHTVPLVPWYTHLLPVMRDQGSIPRGVPMWNQDSPVSVVSLHWWPWHDWSLWPRLRQALSWTVTRTSCRQCDNPTWSHTALLSRFHACCRSSFQLHNRHSRLLGGSPVESLQSHCIHTQFHWPSGPPVCLPSWGTQVQSPGGYLCETGILLLALSHYIVLKPSPTFELLDWRGNIDWGTVPVKEPVLGRQSRTFWLENRQGPRQTFLM